MRNFKRTTPVLATGLLLGALSAQAQLTWDTTPGTIGAGDSAITSGAGTWDTTTGNWTSDAGANNIAWTNGSAAIFGSGSYQVDLTSAGVTVGNLTYGGGGTLEFRGSTASGSPADTITINSGGATWNTGGGEIEFFNDGVNNNTRLAMTSGDTLTVQGGGTFDAGQNPQTSGNGDWQVSGATLDFTAATTVRGNDRSIGKFGTVKLANGSTFISERNVNTTFANAWELGAGAGTVRFNTRYGRQTTLSGAVSGAGRLEVKFGVFNEGQQNASVYLNNAANSFSGVTVDSSDAVTILQINSDGALGATPGSVDADNIILKNGGVLSIRNAAVTIDSNRGITLDGGGHILANSATTYGGIITGTGGLTMGRAGGTENSSLNLSGNSTYTGGTHIYRGYLRINADEALGEGVLTIGGNGTSQFILEGNTQTVGGVQHAGNNTRRVTNRNSNTTTLGTTGTLIIDVADGESYTFGSGYGNNASTQEFGNFNTVKNGLGTQTLTNMQVGGDLTVNNGLMVINDANAVSAGATSVTGGTLRVNNQLTSGSYATSGTGTLQIGNGGTTGNIVNANIANDGAVVVSRSNASTYSGVISGSGSVEFTGGGNRTVSAAQTYTGDTILDNAVLTAGVANVLSADSALRIGGAGTGTSAFNMNGLAQQAGGLNHEAGGHTRELRNTGATATLTLNVATGESYLYTANVAGGGTINLVKTGDGTQTFGRSGGYTTALGDVTVSGGELIWNNNTASTVSGTFTVGANGILSGSGTSGVAVSVDENGTLTGTGTFGATTVAGALNPGNSPGELAFTGALTIESTATTNLEFEGLLTGEFDVLSNDGDDTLTAGGTLALIVGAYTATLGDSFVVFENWGGFAGSFSSITGTDLGGGLSFDTSTLLIDGTLTVIPEPSTYALLAGLLAFVSIAARRRRN